MKHISPQELQEKLKTGTITLIDVREPAEHREMRIPGACLIPQDHLSGDKLPKGAKCIVLHCRSGKRSVAACEKLLLENPDLTIYSLDGGILAWEKCGYALKRADTLSLERQTFIAAGSLVVLGASLGFFLAPAYHILSALVGSGLMFAGITGKCGMMKLLGRMPWNR